MNQALRLGTNFLNFNTGIPRQFSDYMLPVAGGKHALGPWGTVGYQELKTKTSILRHFLFYLNENLSFHAKERSEGLQSLLALRGSFLYKTDTLPEMFLNEKHYILFDAKKEEGIITIPAGRICSFLNTYYAPAAYAGLLSFFPKFKKALVRSARQKANYFTSLPVPARYTVHDAIQAIWFDRYIPSLQKKYIELRLETTLFTLLAQTYTTSPIESITLLEKQQAAAARGLILKNIKVHLPPEQIALELHCSAGWLKKAFSKVYGIGLFQFLRRTRMERAKEMLLKGESLKAVALEVGMKPRNFPKEFKSFFGYTVTSLKKGQV